MSKKGQIALFVIIGIVIIVIILLLLLFLNKQKIHDEEKLLKEKNILKDNFDSAIEQCILENLNQGFYYSSETPKEDALFFKYYYYFIEGKRYIPNLNRVKDEFIKCLRDKTDYTNIDINIKEENIEFILIEYFESEKIKITLYKGVDVNEFLKVSKEIIDEYEKSPDKICLTCYDEISKKYNVKTEFTTMFKDDGGSFILVTIQKNKNTLNFLLEYEE
ncbi:hypothetical protein CO154_01150 [Candidatus Pacearchaeota archaeon CG_4_9_14_3_um_filter_31_7]|nr:MAG: hypothetical protein AUJ10_02885 [Candidatus Pacearchaeota archaeon CG1_02_31_27]PIN92081.1 MAG: hypothetical protein COU55_02755 [Candidatus Pacearchaeota archaeon CG10_big_fil_rev_8_21_14_0_10_31_59]PIZ80296.1 MAG: hypothetical protein COX99_02860 [Candidatus Pacearchaeota archaeon CG_4_10_14_0_2_um_filter_31_10]PJA70747.1 MAG: hypothetical protein CO154_01150 [Candidatus Pacearchaeota archaeon CG_4_9_14_3_um_filter_31_7]